MDIKTKKIILWSIVVIAGLILGTLWVYNSYQKIKNFPKQEVWQIMSNQEK